MKASRETSPATVERSPEPMAASGEIILAVDNDPVSLELLTRTLSREGHRVLTASTGEEALRQAREVHPVAIILDVDMPGMNGWEVLTALKTDPALASIPTIMLTVMDDRNKGFALGAADYLLKPVKRAELAASLQRFLGQQTTPGSVLIVEDDPDNREIMTRLVQREGWSVTAVSNGQAGFEALSVRRPDLILLDLMMPHMDGFTFVHQLRLHPSYRQVPVVVVTAKELTGADRLQLAGMVQKVLQKGSYKREDLIHEVRIAAGTPQREPVRSAVRKGEASGV
jgi:CheY-like chemotaxis protein